VEEKEIVLQIKQLINKHQVKDQETEEVVDKVEDVERGNYQ
jgi:hypothetical protein